jgi:hypothetical protein
LSSRTKTARAVGDWKRAPGRLAVRLYRSARREALQDGGEPIPAILILDQRHARLKVRKDGFELPTRCAFGGNIFGEFLSFVGIAAVKRCAEQAGTRAPSTPT